MFSAIYPHENGIILTVPSYGTYTSDFMRRANHEVLLRRIVCQLINIGEVSHGIVDAGAWIGDNAIPWAKIAKGTVYAIDPSQENINFINKTAELNNINNIKTYITALSNVNETLSTTGNIKHCQFNKESIGNTKVEAVTLDSLIGNDKIDLIHLDVESMEYDVLVGSMGILKTSFPIVIFEQHIETDDVNKITNFLKNLEYTVLMINEILQGCNPDCRNFIAYNNNKINASTRSILKLLYLEGLLVHK